MVLHIAFNVFLFIFGILIGMGLMVSDAMKNGYISKDPSDDKYKWKNTIQQIDKDEDC